MNNETFATTVHRLGRKFEADDVNNELGAYARRWLDAYDGDFGFLNDVKRSTQGRSLTAGQAKGVLNCARADVLRNAPAAADGLDLSEVPSGFYAVPGGDTRLKVRVKNVTRGKWAGWVFVDDGAAYGHARKYGSQKPGGTYSGGIVDALTRIAADPLAASAAYGRLVGSCGRCGRILEDAESVERGIGPVCITKF